MGAKCVVVPLAWLGCRNIIFILQYDNFQILTSSRVITRTKQIRNVRVQKILAS